MLKKFKSAKLPTKITIVLTILLIISLLIFTIWFYFLRSAPKILSIINLNTFPVYINIDGHKTDLNIFDVYNKTILYKNDINIQIYKKDDTLIQEIKLNNLLSDSEIIEIVLSEQEDYCFFSANVSNFYRLNTREINNVNILTNEASNKFVATINPNTSIYIYPGKIVSKEEITDSKAILAVLPISCTKINDQGEIVNVVKVFKDYDSKKQREFYENKLKEIDNINDAELLKKIL